jgi:hypothetical protein
MALALGEAKARRTPRTVKKSYAKIEVAKAPR